MNIGRTVAVFTAEPLVSPVPADETRVDVVSDPAPAVPGAPVVPAEVAPRPVPTRTTAAATR